MIYYEKKIVDPAAEWLLMIHGIGGSINTWKNQIEKFNKKYNLFLFDLDGHGNSDYDERPTKYKPHQMAHTLDEILNKEGIDKVHVVAFSMGTEVAMEFVRHFPDRVGKLVLGGSILNCDCGKRFLFRIARLLAIVLPLKLSYRLCARVILPKRSHKRGRMIFIRESLKMEKNAFISWLVRFSGNKKSIEKYIETINERLISTLFIIGNEDHMFLKGTRKLAARIHNSVLEVIEGCGHTCIIEKREIFNRETMHFLKNVEV